MTEPNTRQQDDQTTEHGDAEGRQETQDEMLRKHREQQGRLRCVGCGEGEEYF